MFYIFDKYYYLINVLEKFFIKEKVKGYMDFDVICFMWRKYYYLIFYCNILIDSFFYVVFKIIVMLFCSNCLIY